MVNNIPQLETMRVRAMKVILTLQKNTFSNGLNQKVMYGCSLPNFLHMEANIQRLPASQGNTATVTIYGMLKDDIESATKFNPDFLQYYNQVEIYAGYLDFTAGGFTYKTTQDVKDRIDNVLSLVFMGLILTASADFNNPNRPFTIQAGAFAQSVYTMRQVSVVQNQTTFSAFLKNIFIQAQNDGLNVKLGTVYPDPVIIDGIYSGSFLQQITQLCHDYNMQFFMTSYDDNKMQIYSFSRIGYGGNADYTTNLSVENGLLGYPTAIPRGIIVKEFFNDKRHVNDAVTLSSYYASLSGKYYVWQIQSVLQTNDELWESTLVLVKPQNPVGGGL